MFGLWEFRLRAAANPNASRNCAFRPASEKLPFNFCGEWIRLLANDQEMCANDFHLNQIQGKCVFLTLPICLHALKVQQGKSSGVNLSCRVTLETKWTWHVSTSGRGRWCLANCRRANRDSDMTNSAWRRFVTRLELLWCGCFGRRVSPDYQISLAFVLNQTKTSQNSLQWRFWIPKVPRPLAWDVITGTHGFLQG